MFKRKGLAKSTLDLAAITNPDSDSQERQEVLPPVRHHHQHSIATQYKQTAQNSIRDMQYKSTNDAQERIDLLEDELDRMRGRNRQPLDYSMQAVLQKQGKRMAPVQEINQ